MSHVIIIMYHSLIEISRDGRVLQVPCMTNTNHIEVMAKKAYLRPYFPGKMRFGMFPTILINVKIQRRKHPITMHHGLVWQKLRPMLEEIAELWISPGSSQIPASKHHPHQSTPHTAPVKIIKDNYNSGHFLFTHRQSGKRCKSSKACATTFWYSYFPAVINRLNDPLKD